MTKKHDHSAEEPRTIEIPISKLKTKDGRSVAELIDEIEEEAGMEEDNQEVQDNGIKLEGDKVLIKFPKFINMLVVHDMEDLIERYEDQEIEISKDFLVDLVGSYEEPDPQLPWGYMVMGIFVGCLLTVLAIKLFFGT